MELAFKDTQNPLDSTITEQELQEKLRALLPRKACGPDGISNEMLKHSSPELQQALLRLFNLVLSVGHFPDSWHKGLITAIHKSGDKLDPNNYRGICVSSNQGKVFCRIINARILAFLVPSRQ
ncbi:RTJK polymerase, partial [Amia calva]|nr:RTJK polymerase [Amia calva]